MAFKQLAREEDIVEGQIFVARTKYSQVGLTRINEEIIAFENLCTHDNRPLDGGELADGKITCPRHGACFDLKTGAVLSPPATADLEVFTVRIVDGNVEADLDE